MAKVIRDKTYRQSKHIFVNNSLCLFCGACVGACPANAMFLWNTHLEIDEHICTLCGVCTQICPVSALSMTETRQEVNL